MTVALNSRSIGRCNMKFILCLPKPTRHFLSHSLPGQDKRDVHQVVEMNAGMLCQRAVLADNEPPLIGSGNSQGIVFCRVCFLHADLYEILPEEPYTEEDLAYYTGGRADQEQDDPSARPGIANRVEDMDQYDTVLLGYPIWHGQAPSIISTFLESYDFLGKTIVPFCTSHSSGIGSSADNLHNLCPDTVVWKEGIRFAGNVSSGELQSWLAGDGFIL